MPTIGTSSKPAYVYDAGTDTWIPIGPGEHTHDYAASAHNHDSTYIAKTLTTTTGDLIYASGANTPARLGIGSTGQVLTVSGGVPSWATVSSSPTFVGCVLTKSVGQSIPNTTVTTITWDVESLDTNNFHDNVTNNNRITIPTGYAGKYLITCGLTWGNVSGGSFRQLALFKNTTQLAVTNTSNLRATTHVTFIADMAVGDYFSISYYQDSGGTNTLEGNNFSKSYFL